MSEAPLVDSTLFIQLGIFLASYVVLRVLVFNPYLKLLHLREEKTSGLKEKGVVEMAQAVKHREDVTVFQREERKKLALWVEEERRKISDEEKTVLQKARSEASKVLSDRRETISKEVTKMEKELLPQVNDYSSQIVSKILGQAIKVNASSLKSTRPGAHAELLN